MFVSARATELWLHIGGRSEWQAVAACSCFLLSFAHSSSPHKSTYAAYYSIFSLISFLCILIRWIVCSRARSRVHASQIFDGFAWIIRCGTQMVWLWRNVRVKRFRKTINWHQSVIELHSQMMVTRNHTWVMATRRLFGSPDTSSNIGMAEYQKPKTKGQIGINFFSCPGVCHRANRTKKSAIRMCTKWRPLL